MKIAIATEGDLVAQHFGRCSEYTIIKVENSKVVEKAIIDNPGHAPGYLPRFLSDMGVKIILSGGMGPKAINLFRERKVEPLVGVSGPVNKIIEDLLNEKLVLGESECNHGKDGHGHDCLDN
ncbi:MAG: NifB/NifX family molybdenum-iron cluster-binding protein [Acidobacteriota bacterium]